MKKMLASALLILLVFSTSPSFVSAKSLPHNLKKPHKISKVVKVKRKIAKKKIHAVHHRKISQNKKKPKKQLKVENVNPYM